MIFICCVLCLLLSNQAIFTLLAQRPFIQPPTWRKFIKKFFESKLQSLTEASDLLHLFKKQLKDKFAEKLHVEMILGKGEARDEIIDYLIKVKADILIIGTRAQGALKRYAAA